MDRVFLDANVLFAAAWRPKATLERLWELDDAEAPPKGSRAIDS
jgi:hypothetical protein